MERWRQVDPAIDVELDDEHVYDTADGRSFGNVRIIDTPDNIERIRTGRMCANCREPFEIPWPRVCNVCGVYVREQQADFFEQMYAGTVVIPGGFNTDEETERMWDELERKKKEAR